MSEKELLELLETVSGQMRSDLSNLYNGIQLLASKTQREQDAQLDEQVAVLDKSYYRLCRLAENLSNSKHIFATQSPGLQSVDMVKFLGDICGKCTSAVYDSGKTVVLHCAITTLVWQVNKEDFEQVVYHLLSNALKYSDDNASVAIRLSQQDQDLQIQVEDSGCGMDETQIVQALQLTKLPEGHTNTKGGCGMGLPISLAIVQRHGGTLTIESQVSQGTTVTITLPQGKKNQVGFADVPPSYNIRSGFNATLVPLADALPIQAFTIRKQD